MTEPASHDDLIQQWLAVNPGTEEQARFYLEANNWNLNAALSNFYEEPPLSEGLPPLRQDDPALPLDPNPAGAGPEFHPPAAAPVVSGGPSYPSSVPQTAAPSSTSVPRRRYGSGARIATLSSLEHAEDDEDEDEDGQDWYAGGERSGMAVRAPPKSDGSNDDDGTRGSLVDRILRRAAEESARADAGGPSSRAERTKPERFTGRGRALGSAEAPLSSSSSLSQPRAGGSNRGSADNNNDHDNDNDNDEVAVRELTFWRNGFSIGDGPLYNTEDPRNRQILEALLQGRAPLDILNVRPGQQVEMKVMRRTNEDYAPPAAPPPQPFSGQGYRLGGISPSISGAPGALPQAQASASGGAGASAGRPITLDPSQRVVQVQVRLADGSRVVAKVNPSHTIGDLRAFVLSERPGAETRPFVFKTVMPPKVLDDDAATVEEAGIANAAIVQHFV